MSDSGIKELPKTRIKPELAEPPLFRVILLNDDYTSMEFVVLILESVFHKDREEAASIMLSVHHSGSGVAGTYTKEVAETKIAIVEQ
jgi:ATP-dependent Clp protease adaptor protein ClpS